ncbi:Fur family transcriptional regulator [Candidatus Poriferisocius sp.]|uniref:Fur family transcriptional regulator n=1 Tax=Candidatus Poriferisocius sp. TaxID=3101276 RepID=UPI003B011AE4
MGPRLVDTHNLVSARLREAGQLYTKGRRELVDLLLRAGRPATIPEMLELRPRLTQSSLYRNMADLESVGVVRRVAGVDDSTRYEFSVDIIGHHHHTICTVCGGVDDFFMPAAAERSLETALDEALSTTGFQPKSHRLDVFGTCPACS